MRLITLIGMLAISSSAQAATLHKGCTQLACVETWSDSVDEELGGHDMRVRVSNVTSHSLRPFKFDIAHQCINGTVDVRTYSVASPMLPKEQRVLSSASPVCVGTAQAPVGARMENVPGPVPVVAAAGTQATPQSGSPSSPVMVDPLMPLYCGPICAPSCNLNFGKSDGCGKGDGEALLVLAAIAAVAIVIVAVTAAVFLLGAIAGVVTAWVAGEALDRDNLEWWQAVLVMDVPLGLGMMAALGTLFTAAFVLFSGAIVLPTAGMAAIGIAAVAAAVGFLALGAVLGGAAIFVATFILHQPKSSERSTVEMEALVDEEG